MIGKIKNLPAGQHLVRLQRYLSGAENERIAGLEMRNLSADSLPDATLLMENHAGLSVRAKKPIVHLTISYAPTDRVSREQMMADADRVLKSLGAQDAQAIIVVHDDKAYKHFHVVYNRVNADGRCISDSNSKRKIESVLRQIESERGLRLVPGRHAAVINHSEASHFKGTRADRRGYVQPPAQVVQAMQTAKTRQELDRSLTALGWRLDVAPPKPGQKAGGLTLRGPNGAIARASDCGRNCSGPALALRFANGNVRPAAVRQAAPSSPVAAPAPTFSPNRPGGAQALIQALKRAKTKPHLPKIAPAPSVTRIIQRVVNVPGPRLKL